MTMRLALLSCLALVACNNPAAAPDPVTQLAVVDGDAQVGAPGYALAQPLAVRLTDAGDHPVMGAVIRWAAEDRDATVEPATSQTDADGVARATWRLGRDDGLQHAKATFGTLEANRFSADARTGEVLEAGGTVDHQCGRFVDDVVRCWASPSGGPAQAVAIDTDLRFASLGFALGRWCGGTRTGAVACFDDAGLSPNGSFRPDAAPVEVVASGVPIFSRIAGAGDPELGITWCATSLELKVYCWGRNASGEVGDGTIGGVRDVPTPVSGGQRAFAIAVTDGASCALDLQGIAWCWGSVAHGVVDGAANSAVPVAVPTVRRFGALAADGHGSMCAIDGGLLATCWGSGTDGGRGRTVPGPSAVPEAIESTDFFTSISGGSDGFIGVTVDRTLVVWGGLASNGLGASPTRVLPGYVFSNIIPGGGDGVACLRAYPSGLRCADRIGLARLSGTANLAAVIHGIPGS